MKTTVKDFKMCKSKNFSMVDILQLTDQISAQDNTSIHLLYTQQLDTLKGFSSFKIITSTECIYENYTKSVV